MNNTSYENETKAGKVKVPDPAAADLVVVMEKADQNQNEVDHTDPNLQMETSDTAQDVDDPWALPELKDQGVKWADLTPSGKVTRAALTITKICCLFLLLYFFICSLDFLSSAFKLLGGKAAGKVFQQNELLKNPVVGLMIGVLATVLVQSSSTSTSIIVTMVGADFLQVRTAIPIVMGANIGTSVTNTIVSLAQSGDRNEFRRAFAGATVHDMFNWLSVIVLLPIETATGYLYLLTDAITSSVNWQSDKSHNKELLKTITKPFTSKIIQLDKNVIKSIAKGEVHDSLIKRCCAKKFAEMNVTMTVNGTEDTMLKNVTQCVKPCEFLMRDLHWGDTGIGLLLLVVSLLLLCTCLILLVKVLHSMLKGRIAVMIKKIINADFPGVFSYFTGYLAILVGCGMTLLVQSSSIFTSAMTPLVGIGVISIERMYPLTLGSNIGTTATGILAALAASQDKLHDTLQIALCHFFFNISGILLFYPFPFTRVPITLAKKLGDTTAKYRWFSILYLIMMFFMLPALVFSLSLAGFVVFLVFAVIILVITVFVVVINVIQSKRPSILPKVLRTWNWLPKCLHSLEPLDAKIKTFKAIADKACLCCKKNMSPSNKSTKKDSFYKGTPGSQIPITQEHSSITSSVNPNGIDNFSYEHTKL